MGRAPVRSGAKHEASPREKLEDVMARLENLALERLPAAHHVAHLLLGLARDPDRRELAGAVEAREFTRVALVMLALHTWPFRNEGRGDDVARISPLTERPVQYVA